MSHKPREFWIDAMVSYERVVFENDPQGNWEMHFVNKPIHVIEHSAYLTLMQANEALAEALELSLGQWRGHARNHNDCDLRDAKHIEGQLYRETEQLLEANKLQLQKLGVVK